MTSMRTRLVVGTVLGMTLVLAFATVLLYVFIRRELVGRFDRSMLEKARLFASSVEMEGSNLEVEFDELDMAEFQEKTGPGYVELLRPDGSLVYRSRSLSGARLEAQFSDENGEAARDIQLPTGSLGRAVSFSFTPRDEYVSFPTDTGPEPLVMVLARDATELYGLLRALAAYLLLGSAATVACSGGLLLAIIHYSTRPLRTLAAQIGDFSEDGLDQRVHILEAPLEIQPVVGKLNELLERLEAAFRRERQFSSDVAHELRTPLSGIRSLTEVALSRSREPHELEETLREVLEVASQMHGLVEKLLTLSRLESGRVELASEKVYPKEVLRDCWQPLASKAEERRLAVRWELDAETDVQTDEALLKAAVQNVIENAVVHADQGGEVWLATSGGPGRLEIHVRNTASGLSPEDMGHIFERFWQADTARTETGNRSGLGLALTAQIMDVLGGDTRAELEPDEMFHQVLTLPANKRERDP